MDLTKPLLMSGTSGGFVLFALSWICNLQRLGLAQNVLIAAFDEEAYTTLYLHGHPVYMASKVLPATAGSSPFKYGEESYKAVTKLKTAAVLEVLRLSGALLEMPSNEKSEDDEQHVRPFH